MRPSKVLPPLRSHFSTGFWSSLLMGYLFLFPSPTFGSTPQTLGLYHPGYSNPSICKELLKPVHLEASEEPTANILALDGGGIHGLYQAFMICYLEQLCNATLQATNPDFFSKPENYVYINEFFDLTVGASVGSLNGVAVNLPDPLNPSKPKFSGPSLIKYYWENSQKIFGAPSLMRNLTTGFGLWGSIHESPEKIFTAVLGRKTFGELLPDSRNKKGAAPKPKHVVAVSYSMTDRQAYFFKSYDDETSGIQLVDGLLASTAAPIYLPSHTVTIKGGSSDRQVTLSDGGLSANNPASYALAEAMTLYPPKDNYRYNVVSIGCGHDVAPIVLPESAGIFSWALGNLAGLVKITKSGGPLPKLKINLSWRFPFIYVQIPLLEIIVDNQVSEVQTQVMLKGLGKDNYYARFNPVYDAEEANKIDDASPEHLAYMTRIANEYCEKNSGFFVKTAQRLVQSYLQKRKK